MIKLNIVFAIGSYLPRTYTWIYNQLKFIKDIHVFILAGMPNPDGIHFPLKEHEIFLFPGFGLLKSKKLYVRVLRKLFWLILSYSRLDLLAFVLKTKKTKCSIIHAHFAYIGWKFIPVSKLLGLPLIVSFYGYDYDFVPNTQPKWKKRYQKLFEYGALFLTEGEFGRKKLIEKGISPDRVKVHHLGVDIDDIPFKSRFLAQGEVLRLVQVASFSEKKGHQILIEAMKLLDVKGIIDKISLTLIGDGDLKKEIISLVRHYNLNQYITFVNHLPYESLHQELLKYQVFIHPSLTTSSGDCEGGAPVVLLDAQATGMPVISTFHCDIPEEVIHNRTGLLVPESNHRALADAILKFLNEPKLITEYGDSGRDYVKKRYSAKIQASILNHIYSNLINKR